MEVMSIQENQIIRTPETIVTEIRATINHVQQVAIIGSIAIGNNLKELKDLVPHGQWLDYIQENLQFNERKVQRFIQISETYGDENSAYHRLISNTTLTTDLSFTKALSLLSVDENEVENFVENNNINDMTVKQLEEQIKALKAANEDLKEQHEKKIEDLEEDLRESQDNFAEINAKIEDLKKDIEEAREENERLQNEDHEDNEDNSEALEELEKELEQKLKELDNITKEKENFKTKIADLEQKQREQEETKAAEIVEAVAKAKEQAMKEAKEELQSIINAAIAEKEEALEQKELAEKKLNNSSNEEILKFKIKADEFQETFNELTEQINLIANQDKEKAEILKGAIKSIMVTMEQQL